MTRYADPQRCPDCRAPIEYGATACPGCGLALQGEVAQRLFATLSSADDLLAQLRAARPVSPAANIAAETLPRFPRRDDPGPGRMRRTRPDHAPRRLSAASVPKILLGLGVTCVLVAALVFLAVTWSAMGVAGRTATLVCLTAVAGGLAALMVRRGLRGAAEALCLVSLGLLTLDTFGARDSGWFGAISTPGFCVLLGALLAVVGAAASMGVRRARMAALTGSEVVSAIGLALVATGIASSDRLADSVALVLAVVVSAALALATHRLKLRFAAAGAMLVTAVAWLVLTVSSAARAEDHDSFRALWLQAEAWPLLVAIAMVAGLALIRRLPMPARVASVAVAELLAAGLLALPFLGTTMTETTLAVLVVLVVTGAQTWSVPADWSLSGALTLVLGSAWMLVVTGELAGTALSRVGDAGEAGWAGRPGDRFPMHLLGDLPAPWLLPVAVAALVLAAMVLVRAAAGSTAAEMTASTSNRQVGIALLSAALVAAGMATLVLYPVPVWVALALLLAAASALGTWAVSRRSRSTLGVAALFLAGGLVLSLHDEWFTVVALAATVVLTGVAHLRWPGSEVSAGSGLLLAPAIAGFVWTWGAIADAERPWTTLVVLIVLAVVVLAGFPAATRLRGVVESDRIPTFLGVEVGALAGALTFALVGLAAAHPHPAGWVAVYLTVAGAAVSGMALLREERRHVAWAGGVLLAMATWVRLWDVGVRVPEAYTLPSALALGLAGLAHLRRRPGSSTMTALSAGLALALVPSLLWALREPFELRSALLGAACLALLLAGLRRGWTAPVVYAATVGAVLVLRLAAPFVDAAVPRWVLIGIAGAVLIAMGVTWERRLQEARQLAGFVRELR